MRPIAILISLSVGLLLGCDTEPMLISKTWGALDGHFYAPGPIYVVSSFGEIDAEQLSLWTWPELSPVAHEVSSEMDGGAGNRAILTPDVPLTAEWYAIRWQGDSLPDGVTLTGGVPLQDGSYVWRFFGVSFPPRVFQMYPFTGCSGRDRVTTDTERGSTRSSGRDRLDA
jgi:hypothetical protein